MTPVRKITVKDIDITISTQQNNEDYICLTDMVKGSEGEDHIRNWMRNKNTIEYLGTWELINNPTFKGVEFDTFLSEAGFNRFNMTPRKWIDASRFIYLHEMAQSQIIRLNTIDSEKHFRVITQSTKKIPK